MSNNTMVLFDTEIHWPVTVDDSPTDLFAPNTVDLQSVRIFHESVWFVRAIGFAYFLWHAQTIRFHEIFERKLN